MVAGSHASPRRREKGVRVIFFQQRFAVSSPAEKMTLTPFYFLLSERARALPGGVDDGCRAREPGDCLKPDPRRHPVD